MPHPISLQGYIIVAGVFHMRKPLLFFIRFQLRRRNGKKWPDITPPYGAHTAQPFQPAAPQQSQQQRFGLIRLMVRQRYPADGKPFQSLVAQYPRRFFYRFAAASNPRLCIHMIYRERHLPAPAQTPNALHLPSGKPSSAPASCRRP